MSRAMAVGVLASVGLLSGTSWAQDSQKNAPARRGGPDATESPKADAGARASKTTRPPEFKVVFWFARDGLRHQAYDVRKGEYTKAVDDWVNRVEVDPSGFVLPGHMATVRAISLDPASGKTESEQLASAIARQERRLLGRASRSAPIRSPALFSSPSSVSGRALGPSWTSRAPGRPYGPVSSAPGSPFPQPVPYPRPHP